MSKSILKGKLIFVADAFDILHQLNDIRYQINSLARTEIISNTIPHYFLVHVKWNFNKAPKK